VCPSSGASVGCLRAYAYAELYGQSVNWDGRWQVEGGVLAPTPHRTGGPPMCIDRTIPAIDIGECCD
jgi:hypothetical protein